MNLETPDGSTRAYLTTNPAGVCGVNRLAEGLPYDPSACPGRDAPEAIWTGVKHDGRGIYDAEKISNSFPWSLTAALTPGGRHVRLYLETEGRIKTMISEKDNFVRFNNEGSPVFYDLSNSRLPDLTLRDPNVSQNDAGVYVMTWDNRDPKIGPGDEADATAVSSTFGLAFSVDGLRWTVYSDRMAVDISGVPRPEVCSTVPTSKLRHVVPVFVEPERLRIYFTNQMVRTRDVGRTCSGAGQTSCGLATAISN